MIALTTEKRAPAAPGFLRDLDQSRINEQNPKHIRDAASDAYSLKTILTVLLHRIEKGLLQYAAEVDLWIPESFDAEHVALENTARWQRESLKPLAKLIERRDWAPLPHSFPAEYSRFHDVSLNFLLPAIVTDLEETLEAIASARQVALRDQDSEALIALNRLQGEQRLLLAELRQHTHCSTESSEETNSRPRETGHRTGSDFSDARSPSRTGKTHHALS